MADLAPSDAGDLLDSRRLLCPLRRVERIPRPLRPIAAGGDDRPGHGEKARPWNDAFVDRATELHIGIEGPFGAEVTLGRDAGSKGHRRGCDGSRHAERQRLLQDLVVPEGLTVWMQEEVRMSFDQPRDQGRTLELDTSRAGRG